MTKIDLEPSITSLLGIEPAQYSACGTSRREYSISGRSQAAPVSYRDRCLDKAVRRPTLTIAGRIAYPTIVIGQTQIQTKSTMSGSIVFEKQTKSQSKQKRKSRRSRRPSVGLFGVNA